MYLVSPSVFKCSESLNFWASLPPLARSLYFMVLFLNSLEKLVMDRE